MFILDAIKKLDSIDSRGESMRYAMLDNLSILCTVRCIHAPITKTLVIEDFKKSLFLPNTINLLIKIYNSGDDYQIKIKSLDTQYDIKNIDIYLTKTDLYSDELCLTLSKGRSITDSYIETLIDIKTHYDKILKEII